MIQSEIEKLIQDIIDKEEDARKHILEYGCYYCFSREIKVVESSKLPETPSGFGKYIEFNVKYNDETSDPKLQGMYYSKFFWGVCKIHENGPVNKNV